MNTFIVATDGSNHASKALEITAVLAKAQDSAVIVMHVVGSHELPEEIKHGLEIEYAGEIESRLKASNLIAPLPDETQYARNVLSHSNKITKLVNTLAGENVLNRASVFLHGEDLTNVTTHMATGNAADAIIEASKQFEADTIVMGCRGTNSLSGLVFGSVSQSVAHRAKCSVVIVK